MCPVCQQKSKMQRSCSVMTAGGAYVGMRRCECNLLNMAEMMLHQLCDMTTAMNIHEPRKPNMGSS